MKPRILLVEDDAVTRTFMVAALEALPAAVDVADSVADAIAIAGAFDHDLWLFDANLPDGDGAGLLAKLRRDGRQTPALAHTAAHEPETLRALRAAGFLDALVKPLTAAALQAAVANALRRPDPERDRVDHVWDNSAHAEPCATALRAPASGPRAVWDDVAALAALNGQSAHVAALRTLFLDDLRAAHALILHAAREADVIALRAALHKLYAGCGFVGAARLGDAARGLAAHPASGQALEVFDAAAQATLSPS